jgi:hypothetical protein
VYRCSAPSRKCLSFLVVEGTSLGSSIPKSIYDWVSTISYMCSCDC